MTSTIMPQSDSRGQRAPGARRVRRCHGVGPLLSAVLAGRIASASTTPAFAGIVRKLDYIKVAHTVYSRSRGTIAVHHDGPHYIIWRKKSTSAQSHTATGSCARRNATASRRLWQSA